MTTTTEWYDHVFNPWRINGAERVVAAETAWRKPEKWNLEAAEAEQFHEERYGYARVLPLPSRPRVFCGPKCDVFEGWKGTFMHQSGGQMINCPQCGWEPYMANDGGEGCSNEPLTATDVRTRLFYVISDASGLDWFVPTAYPQHVKQLPPNVWLGARIENQATAAARLPHLLKVPAKRRYTDITLTGPVDLTAIRTAKDVECNVLTGVYRQWCDAGVDHPGAEQVFDGGPKIDWVLVGGEFGPNAKPCDLAWIRSIVRQCKAAGVPCWGRNVGSKPFDSVNDAPFREFRSFEVWVNKAPTWIGGTEAICVDRIGRHCSVGRDFMRARDEDTFPVRCFLPKPFFDPNGADPSEWFEDLRAREVPG